MAQTIHLASGITVFLRRGFEPLREKGSDTQKANTDGELVWVAEAVAAGQLASSFSDTDQPGAVRIRYVGPDPHLAANTAVRLLGEITARAWYQRGRGGMSASNIEIKTERVERSNDAPLMRGGIPVAIPTELPVRCIDQADGIITLNVEAVGLYSFPESGIIHARCTTTIPTPLMYTEVRPVDLRLFYSRPDQEDVGANRKASFILTCKGVEAPALAGVGNGSPRAPKRNEPQPEQAPPSEG